jgi:hypothetical protein
MVVVFLLLFTSAGGWNIQPCGNKQIALSRRQLRDKKIIVLNRVPGRIKASQSSEALEENNGRRRVSRHLLPISTALVIGSFSVLEIIESSREMAERRIGHAHSIVILAFIRLCRSIAILQTQADEFQEQILELDEESGFLRKWAKSFLIAIGRLLVSPLVAITACTMAAAASAVEIWDDMRPGAHHGAALLALSELYYQVRRFIRYSEKGKPKITRGNGAARLPFGVLIALAAAAYAAMEMYEDMQPGAHHGLAILALAELIENINRSKILY